MVGFTLRVPQGDPVENPQVTCKKGESVPYLLACRNECRSGVSVPISIGETTLGGGGGGGRGGIGGGGRGCQHEGQGGRRKGFSRDTIPLDRIPNKDVLFCFVFFGGGRQFGARDQKQVEVQGPFRCLLALFTGLGWISRHQNVLRWSRSAF